MSRGHGRMPLTREDVRAAVERAGDEHWRQLVDHHQDAYPASRPTPGDVCRREAERLNASGYGDPSAWELLDTKVTRDGETRITLQHRCRRVAGGAVVDLPPFTNYE